MLFEMKKQKSVYTTICSEMSYDDILHNIIIKDEKSADFLDDDVKSIVVSATTIFDSDVEYYFFVDITTIFTELKEEIIAFIPVTIFLLEFYGVTPQQFLDDYSQRLIKEIVEESENKLNNSKGA